MNEMARIIQRLDLNREMLKNMAGRALDTVRRSYSYDEYMPWFENLVHEAWKRPDRRWPQDRPILPPATKKTAGEGWWSSLVSWIRDKGSGKGRGNK